MGPIVQLIIDFVLIGNLSIFYQQHSFLAINKLYLLENLMIKHVHKGHQVSCNDIIRTYFSVIETVWKITNRPLPTSAI